MRGVRYAADTIASYLLDLGGGTESRGQTRAPRPSTGPCRDRRTRRRRGPRDLAQESRRLSVSREAAGKGGAMVYDALVVALGGKTEPAVAPRKRARKIAHGPLSRPTRHLAIPGNPPLGARCVARQAPEFGARARRFKLTASAVIQALPRIKRRARGVLRETRGLYAAAAEPNGCGNTLSVERRAPLRSRARRCTTPPTAGTGCVVRRATGCRHPAAEARARLARPCAARAKLARTVRRTAPPLARASPI